MDKLDKAKKRIIREAKALGVKVFLPYTPQIKSGTIKCAGYFEDEPDLVLAVATKCAKTSWMATMIHEYCHMLQWRDQCKSWRNCNLGRNNDYDSTTIIDMWLEGLVEVRPQKLHDYITRIINVERDCEMRAVRFIKENDLEDIYNISRWIQQSNAYLFFYRAVEKWRKWYDAPPYEKLEIWQEMPDTFRCDYTKLSKHYEQLYKKVMK